VSELVVRARAVCDAIAKSSQAGADFHVIWTDWFAATRSLVPELADRVEALEAELEQLRALRVLAAYRVVLDREYSDEELRNSPYTDAFAEAVVAGRDENRSGSSDSCVEPEPPQVAVLRPEQAGLSCCAVHPYSSGFLCSMPPGHAGRRHGYAGCFWEDGQ